MKKSSTCKIKNINAKSNFQDQKIQFDENVKNYRITVPHDQQYIDFELCESFENSEKIKSKCVKLKSEGSSTIIKAGDYKIEVYRLDNPEKSKKSKKLKKLSKKLNQNHTNKNTKSKFKNLKNKNSNNNIKEILDNDGSDEIDIFDDEKNENNNISSIKEEKINTEHKNNSKIITSCIISLILIGALGACGFLWKKRKWR